MRSLLILLLCCIYQISAQTTFYVNKDGSGNFSSIKEVNSSSLNSGDIVSFKSGQHFSDDILNCKTGVTYNTFGGSIEAILGDPTKSSFDKTVFINQENVTITNLKIYSYKDAPKAIEFRKGGLTISDCKIFGGENSHYVSAVGIDLYENEIQKKPTIITRNEIRDFYSGIYLRMPYNIDVSYNKIYRIYNYNGHYGTGGNCIVGTNASNYNSSFNTQYTFHIHHNELTEYEHGALWIGNISAVLFEYNEVHHNLDERLYRGGVKSGGIGKVWDNTGQPVGSLGHILRYNYIHDIKRYGKPGYKYGKPSPEQIEAGKVIVLDNNTGNSKPIYANANEDGSDYIGGIGNLMSGQGYGNFWIHNNIIFNVGLQVLSKGRNYYKDNTNGTIVAFNSKYRAYFVNNTLLNTGYDYWLTTTTGVLLSEWNSQSPDFIVNNIIDFQNKDARMAGRWKENGIYIDFNIYLNQSGSTNKLPSEGDQFASYFQEGVKNTATGNNERYKIDPGWNNPNSKIFAKNIGINGVYIPDVRIKKEGIASNHGMDNKKIGDNYTGLGIKHNLGKDPTGRSFAYDILGNYRETNDIGAVGTENSSSDTQTQNDTPTITSQPGNYNVMIGDDVTIRINATCDGQIGYQWWKSANNDQSTKILDNEKYSGAETNSLTIRNISITDMSVNYVCEVYNTKDKNNLWINSNPAEIIVTQNTDSKTYNNLAVFLEAPYKNGEMETVLSSLKYFPNSQPYSKNPWNLSDNIKIDKINVNYVDWIDIELRENLTKISYQKAGILRNDGVVLNPDGTNFSFSNINSGNYYLVVRHRNHLSVMTAHKITITSNQKIGYDFTSSISSAYGEKSLIDLGNGKFGMIAGDADANGVINNLDFGVIANNIPSKGYSTGDLDMNGIVNVLDYTFINKNILRRSNVN